MSSLIDSRSLGIAIRHEMGGGDDDGTRRRAGHELATSNHPLHRVIKRQTAEAIVAIRNCLKSTPSNRQGSTRSDLYRHRMFCTTPAADSSGELTGRINYWLPLHLHLVSIKLML